VHDDVLVGPEGVEAVERPLGHVRQGGVELDQQLVDGGG
jgi:hypothetical protein